MKALIRLHSQNRLSLFMKSWQFSITKCKTHVSELDLNLLTRALLPENTWTSTTGIIFWKFFNQQKITSEVSTSCLKTRLLSRENS